MSHNKYNNSQELFKKLDETIMGHEMETSKLKSKDSDLGKLETDTKQPSHDLIKKALKGYKEENLKDKKL